MASKGRRTRTGLATGVALGGDSAGPPVLCLVGKSGAGKTGMVVALVAELKRRGYRVATIKHVGGHDFDIDHAGKDSWRYAQAGSDAVAISSPYQLAIIKKTATDTPLEEVVAALGSGFDLILAEGYKGGPAPQVEVHRRELGPDLLCKAEQLLAVVTDEPLDLAVPQYGFDDVVALTNLIEERLRSSLLPRFPIPKAAGGENRD